MGEHEREGQTSDIRGNVRIINWWLLTAIRDSCWLQENTERHVWVTVLSNTHTYTHSTHSEAGQSVLMAPTHPQTHKHTHTQTQSHSSCSTGKAFHLLALWMQIEWCMLSVFLAPPTDPHKPCPHLPGHVSLSSEDKMAKQIPILQQWVRKMTEHKKGKFMA